MSSEEPPDNIIVRESKMFIWFVKTCVALIILGIVEDAICFHLGRGTDLAFWKALFIIVPLSIIFTYIIKKVNGHNKKIV